MAAVMPYVRGNVLDIGCGVGKLCEYIPMGDYLGVDVDEDSLAIARKNYPGFTFLHIADFNRQTGLYDTIVGMAVIEHVKDPVRFLIDLKTRLNPTGHIVLTTPHAAFGWAHTLGSQLGVFSAAANDEHEVLFTKRTITETVISAGLSIAGYGRFMFGVNQLIIVGHEP